MLYGRGSVKVELPYEIVNLGPDERVCSRCGYGEKTEVWSIELDCGDWGLSREEEESQDRQQRQTKHLVEVAIKDGEEVIIKGGLGCVRRNGSLPPYQDYQGDEFCDKFFLTDPNFQEKFHSSLARAFKESKISCKIEGPSNFDFA